MKTPFVLVAILEAAWAGGFDTTKGGPLKAAWPWSTALVQVTNARINGWGIPSPWSEVA